MAFQFLTVLGAAVFGIVVQLTIAHLRTTKMTFSSKASLQDLVLIRLLLVTQSKCWPEVDVGIYLYPHQRELNRDPLLPYLLKPNHCPH